MYVYTQVAQYDFITLPNNQTCCISAEADDI